MKISIITPTNNPVYLKQLEETVLAQTYQDWEWVILLNNGAHYQGSDDPRIRVKHYPGTCRAVGRLKKAASDICTGEVIAEVDHDDMITPDCLQKLAEAFADPEVGFAYSDNAKLLENAVFTPYLREAGWEYKFFEWKGQKLYSMICQPLYPGRLGYIWFAPDHIRAWSKSVYDSIGGHNEEMEICDDQELMHRLYMATRFRYIPEVLYIYRISGHNTWMKRDTEIQELNMRLYDRHINNLAERFAEINGLEIIDLEDYVTADPCIDCNDDKAGVVYAYGIIDKAFNRDALMKEIHRVLAPGGLLISESKGGEHMNEGWFRKYTDPASARRAGNNNLFRRCRIGTRMNIITAHLEKLPNI